VLLSVVDVDVVIVIIIIIIITITNLAQLTTDVICSDCVCCRSSETLFRSDPVHKCFATNFRSFAAEKNVN